MKNIRYILGILLLGVAMSLTAANKKFTLVIDAGHGGGDTGAIGKGKVKEKDLTLKFALAFGKLVEKSCPDVKVIYTRKTDRFVELYKRAEIANNNKADLFISVHINAVPKGHIVRGFQTYTLGKSRRTGKNTGVLENLEVAKRENAVILKEKDYKNNYMGFDPNSPEGDIIFEFIQGKNMDMSIELAKYMQKYVCQATGRKDMGAHQDNLAVLRLTSMPGCLIELGFISTPDEEQYMNSSLATEQYARGIYNAFISYKRRYRGGNNTPIMAGPEVKSEKVTIPQVVPQKQKEEEAPKKEVKPKAEEKQKPVEEEKPEKPDSAAVNSQPVTEKTDNLDKSGSSGKSEVAQKNDNSVSEPETVEKSDAPVFKVQILVAAKKLSATDYRLKGVKDAVFYQENGMCKYTVGSSTDYNEIYRLRKTLLDKFPEAFIIAFKGDQRVNVQEAIREFKNNKNKR